MATKIMASKSRRRQLSEKLSWVKISPLATEIRDAKVGHIFASILFYKFASSERVYSIVGNSISIYQILNLPHNTHTSICLNISSFILPAKISFWKICTNFTFKKNKHFVGNPVVYFLINVRF
jgi:hypothetical protein